MPLRSAVWLLTVYAPVTHWVWGGGIMAEWGVLDFAGGIVVHATAGTAALVCALVVGKLVTGIFQRPAPAEPADDFVIVCVMSKVKVEPA